jgi:hypothetical protein
LKSSPEITRSSWGLIEIDGSQIYKDVMIYPGGCRAWNWKETGTSHETGISWSDVEVILSKGAEAIVLSKGMLNRLRISENLINELKTRGIEVYVRTTTTAIKKYNKLRKEKKVGGLFHSTC